MAQIVRAMPGWPRKHPQGWEQTVRRRICISKTSYSKWQEVKRELNLLNNDSVAHYLLSLHDRIELRTER